MGSVLVLGGIYAKYFGLSLTDIALVMLIARVADAVTDPLVGYYSDRLRERCGSRKPMILLGALLVVPCSYYLVVPPEGVSITYFACWYVMFYIAWTLFLIPMMAWANDFTRDSREKTLVFSAINIAGQVGGALFYLLPMLPFLTSTDITPEVLKLSVFVGAALFIPGVLLAMKYVPNGLPAASSEISSETQPQRHKSSSLKKMLAILAGLYTNRPFLLYVAIMILTGLASGMWMGLFFIYVDVYLELGTFFAKLSLLGMICGVIAVPLWYRLVLKIGKRTVWLLCVAMAACAYGSLCFLLPGDEAATALLSLKLLIALAGAGVGIASGPILCDIIDYGRFKDPVERGGLYFSTYGLLIKLFVALGAALSLAIAGWMGFDAQAQTQTQTENGIFGLWIGVSWIPALLMGLSLFLIAALPLDERRMLIVRRRLQRRVSMAEQRC